jgi:uncharacterized protein YuzE
VENPDDSQAQNPDGDQDENDSPLEQQYCEIKEFLSRYNSYYISNPAGLYDYEANVTLNDREALLFAYNWLLSHRGYKDSAAYLANFVTVEGALTEITRKTVDAFGQTSEIAYSTYSYDANGECFEMSELHDFFVFLRVSGISKNHIKECRYDDKGKIIGIDLYHASGASINGIDRETLGTRITLEYDGNGNIIKSDFLKNDGKSWSNTFTYNDRNQLVMADYNGSLEFSFNLNVLPNIYVAEYEYDQNGNLIKEIRNGTSTQNPIYKAEYIYNEYGQIKEENINYLHIMIRVDIKRTYTYDDNGRIATIDVIDGNVNLPYKLIYHYEDIVVNYKNQ